MPNLPLISLRGVTKQYQQEARSGVQNIDLQIEAGKIIAVIGESGSGKTTLLKLIYGLLSPDDGKVLFRGNPIQGPHQKLIPGHEEMKMVSQDFNLNNYAKVYENIAAMLPNTDLQTKQQKVVETMNLLKISHLVDKKVIDLSGGEQQRVAIAKAMVTRPAVLLLDEPFSQMDTLLKNSLRQDMKKLARDTHTTVILVSHDPADGLSLADEIVVMSRGEILEYGPPRVLYNQPQQVYTAQLLANSNVLSAQQAKHIGIKTKKDKVLIHPEWICVKRSWKSRVLVIKEVYFKGASTEIMIESGEFQLRTLLHHTDILPEKGQTISVVIKHYLEL